MRLPLEGSTVTAIEQAVAVPLAIRNLAGLGARVIKVERIDGGDLARLRPCRPGHRSALRLAHQCRRRLQARSWPAPSPVAPDLPVSP